MPIYATAGSALYIGGPLPAKSGDFVVADFAAQSFQRIGWSEAIGEFGDELSEITFDAIGEGRTQKLKGIRNAGTMACRFGIDASDAGQALLRSAQLTPLDYAFRVDFNDAGPGGLPSSRYFVAKVMSAREVLDTANSVVRLNASLGINSNVVATPPTTSP